MVIFGNPPILECSSKGDKRFSAFYARIREFGNKSIEEIYQSSKLFLIDGELKSMDNWKDAKGKHPQNDIECRMIYKALWILYFEENPELYDVINQYSGFSDIFGQRGHACQAEEIYNIWLDRKLGMEY